MKALLTVHEHNILCVVFANGPGDRDSIPGRVIPKTQKMVFDAAWINTQHYKIRIKGKVEQCRDGVAPYPILWCSSYWKGSLRVALDYVHQLYLLGYPRPGNNPLSQHYKHHWQEIVFKFELAFNFENKTIYWKWYIKRYYYRGHMTLPKPSLNLFLHSFFK